MSKKAKNVTPDTPITELDFTVQTYNCLNRGKIRTMGEITERSYRDLLRVRNMGASQAKEVQEKVHAFGFTLKGENPEDALPSSNS